MTKNVKSLEEKLSFEKDHHHKAETKQSDLKAELKNLQKKVKMLGKHKGSPVSCEWHGWESNSYSDISEQLLSKASRKQWRCDHAAPELPTGGMIPFSDTTPVDSGIGHILPLIGFTKVGKEGPDPPLPTAHMDAMVPMMSTIPPWGKGDSPTSITGKLPHPLGKYKPRQR